GADHSSARADDLTRNEANPQDIRIAVFLAEAQALREVRADYIAIEDRDLTTPLQQQRGQHLRCRALARAAQAGEPDTETLLVTRGIHIAQDLCRFGTGEPFG